MSDLYKAICAIEDYVDTHSYADVLYRRGRKGNLWTVTIRDNGLLVGQGRNPSLAMAIEQALQSVGEVGNEAILFSA